MAVLSSRYLLIPFLSALLACGSSSRQAPVQKLPYSRGAEVFEARSCYACHTIDYPSISPPLSPDPLPLKRNMQISAEELRAKILSPRHVFKPQNADLGSYAEVLNARDVSALVDFLRSTEELD